MTIESMELRDYHNCKKLHMEFSQGTNIFYGDSAQGKTSILGAVYVCYVFKSHKGVEDRDIVRFNQGESYIKLQIRKNNVPYRIDIYLKKNRPEDIVINGVPIRRANELFNVVNMIFFSPEDLNIIRNGPSERRRFIDMELCQLGRLYVHSLAQYNKALLRHNKLLEELLFRPGCEEALDVWGMQLVNYGREVIKFRGSFIKQLNEIVRAIHLSPTSGREDITTSYEPYTPQDQMEDVLKRSRVQDMKQKTTLSGPHRDDVSSIVSGTDIRRFGSRGQRRTVTLSLGLLELELVKQLSRNDPVLLLGDVLSGLNSSRQNHLLSATKHIQTMITCVGLDDFVNNRFQVDKIFKIVDGTIINKN